MAGTYKNFLKLLESWPLDNTKPGRELGQHIRNQIKIAFSKGEAENQLDLAVCERYYMSLKRIASNHYGQMYSRTLSSSATGLTKEQCKDLIIEAELNSLKEQGKKNTLHDTLKILKKDDQIIQNTKG